MRRRASTTFQRVRKISNDFICAITGTSNPTGDESFFDHDKKGWHHRRPPPAPVRRLPTRKISKDDIRYPELHGCNDHAELLADNAQLLADLAREERQRQLQDPPRPKFDETPFVPRDQGSREENSRSFRSMNSMRRPDRPKDKDLPYGAAGSIPMRLMPVQRPPPPACGARPRSRSAATAALMNAQANRNSVAFPSHSAAPSDEVGDQDDWDADTPPPTPPPKEPSFSPFATAPRVQLQHQLAQAALVRHMNLTRNMSTKSVPISGPMSSGRPGRLVEERRPRPQVRPPEVVYPPITPAQVRRVGAVRRTSSSGDVNLPSQHARYRPERHNEHEYLDEPQSARALRPELRTVKSSLKFSQAVIQVMPSAPPASVALAKVKSKPRVRDLDVPRDVSPGRDNPQYLPTPRASADEERSVMRVAQNERGRGRGKERVKDEDENEDEAEDEPVLIPTAPVATAATIARVQASMRVKESSAPREVKVAAASKHDRPVSYQAQVEAPAPARLLPVQRDRAAWNSKAPQGPQRGRDRDQRREPEPEPESEQRKMRQLRQKALVSARLVQQPRDPAAVFTQQIYLALFEDDNVVDPVMVGQRGSVATGKGSGTKPLVPRKKDRGAAGSRR